MGSRGPLEFHSVFRIGHFLPMIVDERSLCNEKVFDSPFQTFILLFQAFHLFLRYMPRLVIRIVELFLA